MNRSLAIVLVVASLVALGVAAYAYTAINTTNTPKQYHAPGLHNDVASPLIAHGPHTKPYARHAPLVKHHWQHHAPRIIVSNEFRNHVIEILMSDNRTATLLHEGFNVTVIKPVIQGVVEGDGTVSFHAVKAIVVLREKSGNSHSLAIAIVDLVNNKVVRLIEHTVTTWSQQS